MALAEPQPAPGRDTILLVDPDRELAAGLRGFLEAQGYCAVAAATGAAARQRLRQLPVAVLLIDPALPDVDGIAFMHESLKLPSPPDIVVITERPSLESAIAAIEAGAAGYLRKPFEPSRLGAIVARAIERRTVTQETGRLSAVLADRLAQAEALLAISSTVGSTLDLYEALRRISRELVRLTGADAAAAFLRDDGREQLSPAAAYRVPQELLDTLQTCAIPLHGPWPGAERSADRRPVHSDDVGRHPRLASALFPAIPHQSGLFLPLVLGDEVAGAFYLVWWRVRRAFAESELASLEQVSGQAALLLHNARLYQQADRDRLLLETLYQVSRRLAAVHETDQILSLIVNEASRLLRAEGAGIRLVQGDELVLAARNESAAPIMSRPRLRIGESLSGIVVATGEPVAVEDLADDTRYDPAHKRSAVERGFHGFLGVPLRARGQTVGTLNVYTKGRRRFLPEEISLLSGFADQASLAIEKGGLLREAEEGRRAVEARAGKLTALSRLTRLITSAQDSRELCQAIAKAAATLLGAAWARVWVANPLERVLRVAGSFGLDPAFEQEMLPALGYGQGLVGRIFESQVPEFIEDVQQDPRWRNQRLARDAGFHAHAGIPLVTGDRVVGVLSLLFGERRGFLAEEQELMGLLADHAAIAIDKLKLYEEAETQRTRLRLIFDSTSDGIVLLGRDGRVEATNRRAAELLGFEPARIVGIGLSELLAGQFEAPGDYERLVTLLRVLVQDPERGGQGDIEVMLPVRRILHWVGRPTRNAAGTAIGLTLTFQDVTEERKVSQMKSDFVSFVTHQLRTPLAGIKWLLELATQGGEPPDVIRSYIDDARQSNERLIRLVNDLLNVSRLESGKLTVVPQATHLGELTGSVVDELESLVREQGHRLSVSGAEAVPTVRADPQLLRQVILNLVSNAIKYTRHGGSIAIRMSAHGGRVRWAIQDSGIGIPKEAQRRLFEKFFRADNVLSVETEGTGLGLYLVRLIVEQFGGQIWCESEEGQGATFIFTLPLAGERP